MLEIVINQNENELIKSCKDKIMTKILKPTRRSFITGACSLPVAPAIVRFENIMPVKNYENIIRHFYEFTPSPSPCLLDILYGQMILKTEWINDTFEIKQIPLDELLIQNEKN